MTLLESIDLVVARTGVERYRYLCLEHPRPKVRAEYSAWVVRKAAEPFDPTTIRPYVPASSGGCQGCPEPPLPA